ncbi:hypothetical protein TRFO_25176 [Tritrichomonas foetus]|uniref:Uncharacterized protein n=1 Tax=Tritrichomonas foetus TaxID=1144522 RepID=A0A1J4K6W3_9EUKA|nr:hypothetical protein TRFO_25176 [Tritrichomonas foetus]|eukprot:OHT06714.1 hypothetical protein TRFO_25176 [Tritrichomonas foetus]
MLLFCILSFSISASDISDIITELADETVIQPQNSEYLSENPSKYSTNDEQNISTDEHEGTFSLIPDPEISNTQETIAHPTNQNSETVDSSDFVTGDITDTIEPPHNHTEEDTHDYTEEPTHVYTEEPTHVYTEEPTHVYTEEPTHVYTEEPTHVYTEEPTHDQTNESHSVYPTTIITTQNEEINETYESNPEEHTTQEENSTLASIDITSPNYPVITNSTDSSEIEEPSAFEESTVIETLRPVVVTSEAQTEIEPIPIETSLIPETEPIIDTTSIDSITPAPTQESPTVEPTYVYTSEKFCVCEGSSKCSSICGSNYEIVAIKDLGFVIKHASKNSLTIKLHGTTVTNYPTVLYDDINGKEFEIKTEDDEPAQYFHFTVENQSSRPKLLEIENIVVVVNFVESKLLELDENSTLYLQAENIELSDSQLVGSHNYTLIANNIESDLISLSDDSVITARFVKYAKISNDDINEMLLHDTAATISNGKHNVKVESLTENSDTLYVKTEAVKILIKVDDEVVDPFPLKLKIDDAKKVKITLDNSWKGVNNVHLLIDHGDADLEIVSSIPEYASLVDVDGDGDVYRNGEKDKKKLKTKYIIIIAVVCCVAFIALCVGIGFGIRYCKRKADKSGYQSNVILEPL